MPFQPVPGVNWKWAVVRTVGVTPSSRGTRQVLASGVSAAPLKFHEDYDESTGAFSWSVSDRDGTRLASGTSERVACGWENHSVPASEAPLSDPVVHG